MRFPFPFALAVLLTSYLAAGFFSPVQAQAVFGVTVNVAPPILPIYIQPPIPAPGYLWEPGYWAWDTIDGYYWVPGTWVLPPRPTLLWTPGYWGWSDGIYIFHQGYWAQEVGFYGGVSYGFGYTGHSYEGGYWKNGSFYYNQSVNNVTNVQVTNVYNKTIIVNNTTNVSYNGGSGGIVAQPTPQQAAVAQAPHVPPTPAQTQHAVVASKTPALLLSTNHGMPSVAATPHSGVFKGPGIVAPALRQAVPASAKPPSITPTPPSAAGLQGGKPPAAAPLPIPPVTTAKAPLSPSGPVTKAGVPNSSPAMPASVKPPQQGDQQRRQLLDQQKAQQAAQHQQELLQQQKAQQAAEQKTQQAAAQHQQQLLQQQKAQQAAQQQKAQQAAQQKVQQAAAQHQQLLLQQQKAQQAAQQQKAQQAAQQQQQRAQQAAQQHRECGKPGQPPCR